MCLNVFIASLHSFENGIVADLLRSRLGVRRDFLLVSLDCCGRSGRLDDQDRTRGFAHQAPCDAPDGDTIQPMSFVATDNEHIRITFSCDLADDLVNDSVLNDHVDVNFLKMPVCP
jgi:hypothetical protein